MACRGRCAGLLSRGSDYRSARHGVAWRTARGARCSNYRRADDRSAVLLGPERSRSNGAQLAQLVKTPRRLSCSLQLWQVGRHSRRGAPARGDCVRLATNDERGGARAAKPLKTCATTRAPRRALKTRGETGEGSGRRGALLVRAGHAGLDAAASWHGQNGARGALRGPPLSPKPCAVTMVWRGESQGVAASLSSCESALNFRMA